MSIKMKREFTIFICILFFLSNTFMYESFMSNKLMAYADEIPIDNVAPSPPANLASMTKTDTTVNLSWEASTDNVGVSFYRVFNGASVTAEVSDTSCIVQGLNPLTTYNFTVKALDGSGNISEASNEISVTTNEAENTSIPVAPTNITTLATNTTITVTWDEVSDTTGYDIEVDGTVIDNGTSISYVHNGLEPNTQHTYRVRAKNSSGTSDWSETSSASTVAYMQSAPENIIALQSSNSIEVRWDPILDSINGEPVMDLLSGKGDIDQYGEQLSYGIPCGWPYQKNSVVVWRSGLVKTIDNEKCIDGYFSDFEWPLVPRGSYIHVPTVSGHKYLVYAEINGQIDMIQINPENGQQLGIKSVNQSSWTPETYIATGNGDELVLWFRGGYITEDIGYFKNVKVIDLNTFDDSSLSEEVIADNISDMLYNSRYEIEVDGEIVDNKKSSIFEHTSLQPSTTHTYRIRQIMNNAISDWSSQLNVLTLEDNNLNNPVNLALGKPYTTSEVPDGAYPDTNNFESTDGILAYNYSDGKSYGFRIPDNTRKTISVILDLGSLQYLNMVKMHKWEGSGNYDPDKIVIYTSQDGSNFQSKGRVYEPHGIWRELSFPYTEARYIKLEVTKYNSLNANDWLFIDEIQAFCLTGNTVGSTETTVGANTSQNSDYLCDGTEDNIQIQAAIDYISSIGGGEVHILAGIYYPSAEIQLKDNVKLQMDEGAVIKLPNQFISKLSSNYTSGQNYIDVEDASGFYVGMNIGIANGNSGYIYGSATRIEGIEGNRILINPSINVSYSTEQAYCFSHFGILAVHDVDNVSIIGGELDGNTAGINVFIVNADSMLNGIASDGSSNNIHIQGVYIHGMRFQGIHPWGEHNNFVVEDCLLKYNGAGGIVIDTVPGSTSLIDNVCIDNGHAGIKCIDSSNVNIVGGQYDSNAVGGIETFNTSNCVITGSACSSNQYGISIVNSRDSFVINSTISNNTVKGISLSNGSRNISIDQCTISGSSIGICEESSDYNIVSNCLFENCEVPYILSGLNTIIDKSPAATGNVSIFCEASKINVSWNAVGGATGYDIEVDGTVIDNGTSISYTHTDLTPDTEHTYRIRAKNAYGTSEWTELLLVKTQSDELNVPTAVSTVSDKTEITVTWDRLIDAGSGLVMTNLLGDKGSIIKNETAYANGFYPAAWPGTANPLVVWDYGLIREVDGYKCLDGNFGDFAWPTHPRTSYVHIPTIAGHKYVVYSMVKGNIAMEQIKGSTGEVLGSSAVSNAADWVPAVYSATGDGSELIVVFRGGYVTSDIGYFRDVVVVDVTELGDGSLTDTELKSKYSSLKYFEGTQGNLAGTGYDIEVDGTVIDNGTSTSYTHTGLTPDTAHTYRIRAKNAYGVSEWSNAINASALSGIPNIPECFTKSSTNTQVTLTWDRLIDLNSGMVMTNMLGDKGSISKNEAAYANGFSSGWPNPTNPLVVWLSGMVKEVDGYKCLDGYFSDFAWPQIPRANYVHIPTIAGHKYVVHSMVKGNIAMEQINGSTGQLLGSTVINSASSWTPAVYTATGDGTELIVVFRGGYVTSDIGYFRDVVVVDITELGDGSLTDIEIKSKYSSLKYFEGTQGNPAGTGYDLEVDGIVIDNGTSTSYTHTGLTPDTEHTYRIRAKNAYGTSEWSTSITAITLTDVPNVPTAVSAASDKTEIAVTWDRLIDDGNGLVMTNLLGDKGSISKNEMAYANGFYPAAWPNPANPLVVWTSGLVREVDGYKCLDGYFSDFAWPTHPRTSYVHVPTIAGHKYVVHSMLKGNITMEQINGSTGQLLGSTVINSASSWIPAVYTATGDGSELIVVFRGGYVTSNIGYFRDVVVVDVTELGDGSLTTTEIKSKYSSLKYFEGTQGNPAGTSYDIEVDGIVIDNGTSPSYTHTGLTPDTEHTYRIRAKNAYGMSEWSTSITAITSTDVPNVPACTSTELDATEITVSWDQLIDNGSGLVMTNLLGDKGSISKNETAYANGFYPAAWPNPANPLVVWTSGLVREVDGYKCLDGYFSDFAWPTHPRTSYVHVPTIAGHKYVVHSMVKGYITMEQINGSTGQLLGSMVINSSSSWIPAVYTATGDGTELIVVFRGGYVTSDIGYFSDVVVVDVTELGDGSLTDTELKSKYSSLKYFEGTQGNPAGTGYDIEVDGTVIDNGTSTSYIHSGLTPDTEHTYRIMAKNAYGVSEWSTPITVNAVTTIETNLALGKTYSKSEPPDQQFADNNDSESTDGILAGNYSDGNSYGYRVPVNTTKTVEVTMDLGGILSVNNVKVHKWEGSQQYGADTIRIYESQDGTNYELIEGSDISDSRWMNLSFSTISTRYIKVEFSKTNTGAWGHDWLFIDEIQVYKNETINENLALGKTYTKSGQPNGAYADNNGCESTDGILAYDYPDGKSYGYSVPVNTTKTVEVTVDLGDVLSINNVKVHEWEGSQHYGADTIRVYESQDGTNYRLIEVSGISEYKWTNLSFSTIETRYVKVEFSKTNTGVGGNDWLFIDEIQVYNQDIPTENNETTINLSTTSGSLYDIPLNVSNISSFTGKTFTITYDASVLELVDLCGLTNTKETTTGLITGTGITISGISDGSIVMTVDKNIPIDKKWSGVINVFKFKAKTTGETSISAEY